MIKLLLLAGLLDNWLNMLRRTTSDCAQAVTIVKLDVALRPNYVIYTEKTFLVWCPTRMLSHKLLAVYYAHASL